MLSEWPLIFPLFGAVAAWLANEWRKRESDIHLRKEEHYKFLLLNLSSFMEGGEVEVRGEMLKQLQLCWLYCPEKVILKANAFMDTVKVGSTTTQEEKNLSMQLFVIAIREDMLPWYRKNSLGPSDVIARSAQ